ncbi:MAG: hypothetical protein ABIO91_04720 [Pyrinomonadaceae bacterium]
MKDVTFSNCKFSSDMVPYMYAELSAAETSSFESHLLECTACTDEFASLSIARFEVYDWKKVEFDGLETPVFSIPFESSADAAPSWIDKLRAAFSAGWAVPTVAFAGLAVVCVFAGILVSTRNNADVAADLRDTRTTAENPAVETAAAVVEPGPSLNSSKAETRAKSQFRAINASAAKRVQSRRVPRSASPSNLWELKERSARNFQKNVPRLNEFVEDEDTSLRLAELFDDVGTRN